MKKINLLIYIVYGMLFAQDRSLVINECMPNNYQTAEDQDGEYNDWLELYNVSNTAKNLQGYFLSDRRSVPTKFEFPYVEIESQDYLIIWLDKDTMQTGLHTNFKLSASNEQVYFFDPDTNLIDYVHFLNMQADESIARTKDGNGPFQITSPSFNSSNGNNSSGIVINEWMAWNASEEEDEFGEYNDWIELYNNSNVSINLQGYFLSNKANEETKYQFPDINIGANDYLILWADEDTLQGALHLPFKLDSERDDIVLARPDTSTIDYFFHQEVDSNLTQARIPNGFGNIARGNSTLSNSNQPYVLITEQEKPEFTLYPNPCSDFVILNNLENDTEYYELLDTKGCLLKRIHISNEPTLINTEQYKSGIYYVRNSKNKLLPFIKTSTNLLN